MQRYGTGDITTAIFKTAPEDVVSDFPAQVGTAWTWIMVHNFLYEVSISSGRDDVLARFSGLELALENLKTCTTDYGV